jgi:hypothetical protein
MLLAHSKRVSVPGDLLVLCVRHLLDPSPVARYYVSIGLGELLQRTDDTDGVRAGFGRVAGDLFRAVLTLSEEFQDGEIGSPLLVLLGLFADGILPLAADLSNPLLALLLQASAADRRDQVDAILSGLDVLAEIVSLRAPARGEAAR